MADGTTIDDLQIEIGAKAQTANDAIDRLVTKLDRLQTSLSKVNGSQLTGLANGVDRLGKSMQVMNTIKTADFTRLATNLTKLGNINVSALNSSASSLSHLSRAFNTLGNASQNAQSVVTMASSLSKLGGASVQRAITNIPLLATAMNNLMVTLSKSPRVSNNVIQLTNALANLATQGAKVGSASRSIEKGLNRANNSATRASKSFGGLASAIGKFYATYFLVIRGIKGLYKSIESTADYLEAFNYFNVALGKIGSDWSHQFEQYGYESAEAYADSFSTRLQSSLKNLSGLQISIGADENGLLTETGLKNLGLNIQEITQYASQLASVTNSVGQVGEVSLAAANSLTKLGADLSSLFNLDYSSVMQNLQSGLIGQSRALYKYGIDITNATLQTYAYELGLEKAVSEMTQAEKMQLRLIAILDQSKVSWGDLANTINSPSNMIRQFKNNLKEVGMVLGQLFIPLMQKVMPVINGVTIALKRLLVNIAGFLGIQLDLSSFGQGYSGLGEDVDGLTDSLDDATESAKKLKTVTLGIDELNINAPQDTSGTSTGGVGGGIDLTDEILTATSEYEKVWEDAFNNMENKAQEFANKIEKIFEPITKPLQNLFKNISIGDWFSAGKNVSDVTTGLFDLLTNGLKKINWKDVGTKIGEFLKGIEWDSIINSVGNFFETLIDSAVDLWKGSFEAEPVGTAISSAIVGWFALNTLKINPKIAVGVITWEIGFDFGKKLAAGLTDNDQDFQDIMNFTWFGEDGFFAKAFTDAESSIEAFGKLFDSKENGTVAFISKLFFGPIGTVIGDGINILNNETVEKLGNWWNESVAPWLSKEKWMELGKNIPIAIAEKWNDLVEWWNTNGIKKWFDEKVKPWLSRETWENNILGIKIAFSNTFKNVANGAIGWLNKIISGIETLVNNAISGLNGISDLINKIPGVNIDFNVSPISLPDIPTYEVGGYPKSASLFWANENGVPELVGNIGNQTAVASGTEITGISTAIYDTAQQEIALLREQNNLLMELLRKDMSVNIGDREIARANARGQRSLGYALIT